MTSSKLARFRWVLCVSAREYFFIGAKWGKLGDALWFSLARLSYQRILGNPILEKAREEETLVYCDVHRPRRRGLNVVNLEQTGSLGRYILHLIKRICVLFIKKWKNIYLTKNFGLRRVMELVITGLTSRMGLRSIWNLSSVQKTRWRDSSK